MDERDNGPVAVRPRVERRDDDLSATRWSFDESDDDRDDRGVRAAVRTFVDRYGWRAYALPLLVVITVVALMTTTQPARKAAAPARPATSHGARSAAPTAAAPTTSGTSLLKTDQAGANAQNEALASDTLPAGGPYTVHGTGTFSVLPGSGPVVGSGTVHRYTVEVENGVTGVDLNAFSHIVDTSLDDPRSWTRSGLALQRVDDPANAEFHVTLTSSMSVRNLCGYELQIETSCWAPDQGSRVVLNVARWVRGDLAYVGDLATYHVYMVNHEVGHALGHMHSHVCLADGLGPVMMQQTIGLKSVSGKICQANPWPYPPGAKDAPGVESADTPQNSPLVKN